MNHWEHIPLTQERPDTDGYFSNNKERSLIEYIVSTQLSDLLSDYGHIKETKLTDVNNPNNKEIKSYFGLFIPTIPLRRQRRLQIGQFPWRDGEHGEIGAFGTEEGLYSLTVIDSQNNPALEVAVWDPSIETEHRIYDNRGRAPTWRVLHEMYDALTVINQQLALSETISNLGTQRARNFPIAVVEPDVEIAIIDFNQN